LKKSNVRRREASVFNLAFLDIMSCGLGAVVLIFLLIKHNTDQATVEDSTVTKDTAQLISANDEFNNQLKDLAKKMVSEVKSIKNKQITLENLSEELNDLEIYNSGLKQEIEKSKEIIDLNKKETVNSMIEVTGQGQRNYLVGMNVEGKKIAIILDRSSSMSDELLVNILRRKLRSDQVKAQGDKWKKAVRISQWLISRLPENSDFQFLSYNDKVYNHSKNGIWNSSRDKDSVTYTMNELNALFPDKGTNLTLIFEKLTDINPRPTDIYIITDGLPTLSNNKLFKSSKKKVSSSDRIKYFHDAVNVIFKSNLKESKINVILLPMEGDVSAGEKYWDLTNPTDGSLMSPSKDWP